MYMFLLILSAADLIPNVEAKSSFVSSSCDSGNWGAFLSKNCSGGAFCDYLYALALRANQTGHIFFTPNKQRKYSSKMKANDKGLLILIGGSVGLFMVIIFSIMILSQRRNTPITPLDKHACKPALSALLKDSEILEVSIEEVYAATNNLLDLNFIGEGTSGKVYRGILSNNQHVAIKKIKKITEDGFGETFIREITSLVRVRRPNLVPLVGYCENESESFLIYELCPNGNLSERLYGEGKFLSWIQRLEITIGCARGLRFLHTFHEGCIVHLDVKPTNILLGAKFEAKLSVFGLSKVMNLGESCLSSEVRGSFGYVDPEYQSNGKLSTASDIYSFGIVLLQILSGRKVINMNMKKPMPLDKIAKSVTNNGSTLEFADPKLNGEYSVEAFELIFEVAVLCTGTKQQRPDIRQVEVVLQEAVRISMRMKGSSPYNSPDLSEIP
ncbi:Serine/threonine protein kinase [Handroanthus impetiginosus]|uniref:Serine/threonine protein kinase n=1 Tax=Handroanthus impetiginosus TaxID=429701 RepID=A0A2G9G8R5_9LAMI|nr:Serine/threonine protein kinase [Handroanthus impetiginosus]